MHIGIVITGHPSSHEGVQYSYSAMIRQALGDAYHWTDIDVTRGELPSTDARFDAYIITGSPQGVHDASPWITALRGWLIRSDPQVPLVGICFGHQIMAEAFGGKVGTSTRGWTAGLCTHEVEIKEHWMDSLSSFVLPAFNRDQVVQPPAASRAVARSAEIAYAVLSYAERRAISFQTHPEFSREYTALLLRRCEEAGLIDAARARLARASLVLPDDCARVRAWIRHFLARREIE